jgi:RNA polymerase sigma-70 factor (ECF subfamily)
MNHAMTFPIEHNAGCSAGSGEALLIRGLQGGDPRAYETLVREFGPRMLAVAQRMLKCRQDAADAVQDAFVSAFRAIGSFESSSSLGTWLHRVTVNACLMLIRKRSRKGAASIEELLPQFDDKGHHAQPVARWGGALEHIETQETCARVRACIDRLPDSYRTVLFMRDIGEMDTQATAAALNTTEGNVKTRLHRARQMLRTLLEKEVIGGGLPQL